MHCVVPLAGPDLFDPSYGIKPFMRFNDRTLIEATLGARPWLRDGRLAPADITFVVRRIEQSAEIAARLQALFPGSSCILIDRLSPGAPFTALAGAALHSRPDAPLVIDLVDVVYACSADPLRQLLADPTVAGVLPWFPSSDEAFSYLQIENGRVVRTAEKQVISAHASAGTYFFSNAGHFLVAMADAVRNPARYRVRNSVFVCPLYNKLIEDGLQVAAFEVSDVAPVSKTFHAPSR